MKFLIIGASSFIGRHIFNHVKSLKYGTIGTQCSASYPQFITFDILRHRIKDRIEPDFFKGGGTVFGIICLAIARIDHCLRERETSHRVNVENTIRLVDDIRALNATPVFLSSDNVYDGFRGDYTEDDEPCPVNEYGRQKQEVEKYLYSIPGASAMRLSKIVGDDPREEHLFTEWYRCVKGGKPIVCIKGQIFSPTFVNDIAKAVVLVGERRLSGLYNVANKEVLSRAELAGQFLSAIGEESADIIEKPQKDFKFLDRRSEKTYLDSAKFIKATGMHFTPMRDVFESFIKNLETVKQAQSISYE